MQPGNDHPAAIDYAGTCEPPSRNIERVNGDTARSGRSEPTVLVELVVIDGVEGQKLHAIQSEVVRRILARLAERQVQSPEKESRL
jgi:hypothetical protein